MATTSNSSIDSKSRSKSNSPPPSNCDLSIPPSSPTVNYSKSKLLNPPKPIVITFQIIFILYFSMSLLVVLFSSNIFVSNESIFSDTFCQIQLSLYPGIYITHKTAVYWMFSFRIQYAFNGTHFAFPSHYYLIFRIAAIIVWLCLVSGTLYTLNPHFYAKYTSDGQYIACTATDIGIFEDPSRNWMMFFIQIMDTIFGVGTVYAFGSRLKMIINGLEECDSTKINTKLMRELKEYHGLIKKSTVLLFIALLSTWNFMGSLMLDLNLQNAFTVVDMMVNTICVVLMFKLPLFDIFYDSICGKICGGCCNYKQKAKTIEPKQSEV